jgi:hypothetical protein
MKAAVVMNLMTVVMMIVNPKSPKMLPLKIKRLK